MAKIIKINNSMVLIGMDDGSTLEAAPNDFNFEIKELMIIDVHKHNDTYIFSTNNNANTSDDESEFPGKVYVDKTSYGILRLFFGLIGVHHFYAGNKKYGIISVAITVISFFMMIAGAAIDTLGLAVAGFAILGIRNLYLLISSIVILCKTTNKNGKILVSSGK